MPSHSSSGDAFDWSRPFSNAERETINNRLYTGLPGMTRPPQDSGTHSKRGSGRFGAGIEASEVDGDSDSVGLDSDNSDPLDADAEDSSSSFREPRGYQMDEEVIRDAILRTSGVGREAMRERIAEYRNACQLSEGPDPGRTAYWILKAKGIEREIARMTPSEKVAREAKRAQGGGE